MPVPLLVFSPRYSVAARERCFSSSLQAVAPFPRFPLPLCPEKPLVLFTCVLLLHFFSFFLSFFIASYISFSTAFRVLTAADSPRVYTVSEVCSFLFLCVGLCQCVRSRECVHRTPRRAVVRTIGSQVERTPRDNWQRSRVFSGCWYPRRSRHFRCDGGRPEESEREPAWCGDLVTSGSRFDSRPLRPATFSYFARESVAVRETVHGPVRKSFVVLLCGISRESDSSAQPAHRSPHSDQDFFAKTMA